MHRAWKGNQPGFLLVYPGPFEVARSSLGLQFVSRAVDSAGSFYLDYLFLDKPSRVQDDPRSFFGGFPPRSFNIIGFSIPFELDFGTCLKILYRAGIPLTAMARQENRKAGNQVPLVLAGGSAVSANPFPLLPYLDFIFLFDSEMTLPGFLELYLSRLETRGTGETPVDASDLASCKLPGIIAMSGIKAENGTWASISGPGGLPVNTPLGGRFYPIEQCWAVDPAPREKGAGKTTSRQGKGTNWASGRFRATRERRTARKPSRKELALGNTYLLEIGRGCGHGCRFCLLGYHLRPPRFMSIEEAARVISAIKKLPCTFEKISLIGSNVGDHPGLADICEYILDHGFSLSLPSIRALDDDQMLDIIGRANIKTITIAPETGSARLQRVINKNADLDGYLDFIDALAAQGVKNLKVYLIHGLPFEQREDVDETLSFVQEMATRTRTRGMALNISANPFIPKMGTPFMFHVENFMSTRFKAYKSEYRGFLSKIHKLTRTRSVLQGMSPTDARMQAYLSLAGTSDFQMDDTYLKSSLQYPPVPDASMDRVFDRVAGWVDQEPPPGILQIIPVKFSHLVSEWKRASNGKTTPTCPAPEILERNEKKKDGFVPVVGEDQDNGSPCMGAGGRGWPLPDPCTRCRRCR